MENKKLSFFTSVRDKSPKEILLEEAFRRIKSDEYKTMTERYRDLRSKGFEEEANACKARSAAITASALCVGGHSRRCAQQHTRLIACDFDNIPVDKLETCKQKLKASPFVALTYETISKSGIRVLVPVNIEKIEEHAVAFTAVNEYLSLLIEHPYDDKCKDVTRLSFLCYDPDAYYNPEAETFQVDFAAVAKAKKTKERRVRENTPASEEFARILKAVEEMLAKNGVVYQKGSYNKYVSETCYLLNEFGVPKSETLNWVVMHFPDYHAKALYSIVESAYNTRAEKFNTRKLKEREPSSKDKKEEEEKENNFSLLSTFIREQCKTRRNTLSNRIEICWADGDGTYAQINDNNENTLWVRARNEGFRCTPSQIQSLLNSEFTPKYDPISDYFNGLPPWDGTDYIRQVAQRIHTDTPELLEFCFKKWFVSMVASWLKEKNPNHTVFTLIGKQGIYKTSFFSYLLPPEFSSYFFLRGLNDNFSKDDILRLGEFLLSCFEEIDTMNESKLNTFKAIVTMDTATERKVYERHTTTMKRVCSLCATGNKTDFLNSGENERRWLPFLVNSIDNPRTNPLPYEGLYAQAYALIQEGFRYWFEDSEMKVIFEHSKMFHETSIEEELINEYYRVPKAGDTAIFVTSAQIMSKISYSYHGYLTKNKITKAMRILGFNEHRRNNARGFLVYEYTHEEREKIRNVQFKCSDNQEWIEVSNTFDSESSIKPQSPSKEDNQQKKLPFEEDEENNGNDENNENDEKGKNDENGKNGKKDEKDEKDENTQE